MSAPSVRREICRILSQGLLFLLAAAGARAQQEVRFHVLGLFHTRELVLEQGSVEVLSVAPANASGSALVLSGEPGHRHIVFRALADRVVVDNRPAESWRASARDGGMAGVRLSIPGKIRRDYFGRLTVEAHAGEIFAFIAMERDTAVASIVGAEMNEAAPIEALKAQAVVARSFLVAGARHKEVEFCDTTHCQFLRSPPPPNSRIWSAVAATRDLVIAYRDKPLAAMYSSRCGGTTRSLRDVGADPGNGYPYYAVPCRWCREHPLVWRNQLADGREPPEPGNEAQRIARGRQWGWSAVPGNDFNTSKDGGGWELEGHNLGHGLGMCQAGAIAIAASGADFRTILAHYYPNTSIMALR